MTISSTSVTAAEILQHVTSRYNGIHSTLVLEQVINCTDFSELQAVEVYFQRNRLIPSTLGPFIRIEVRKAKVRLLMQWLEQEISHKKVHPEILEEIAFFAIARYFPTNPDLRSIKERFSKKELLNTYPVNVRTLFSKVVAKVESYINEPSLVAIDLSAHVTFKRDPFM